MVREETIITPVISERTRTLTFQRDMTRTLQQPAVKQIQQPITKPISKPITRSLQRQQQKTLQQPIQRLKLKQPTIQQPIQSPLSFTPTPTGALLPAFKLKKGKAVPGTGYKVLGKRKGKFKDITPGFTLSRKEAKAFGFKWAKGGLGATFKIQRGRAPVKTLGIKTSPLTPKQFRAYRIEKGKRGKQLTDTFIQKRGKIGGVGSRLGTRKERAEIQFAKRKKAKKKKLGFGLF